MGKYVALCVILTGSLAFSQTDAPKPAPGTIEAAEKLQPGTPMLPHGPDAASEQDKRILGVLPNYRTADGTKTFVPMTAKGKMTIAFKDSFDYPGFLTAAGLSLIYQAENSNPSFGQGVKGYAHRYGTAVGDQIIGNMLAEGIMPVLLKEDPRYFRKINGTFMSRLIYSTTRTLITKNDNGRLGVNFAELGGNGISAAIGAAYYPDGRTYSDTFTRMGTSIATDTLSNVLKEFWPDIKRKYSRKHDGAP
jgi:hypothetical protein